MKKLFALLCAAALVCLVSCEKEKDKEKNPDNPIDNPIDQGNPGDSVQLNLFSAIRLPVVESNSKASGHYDALSIYNNVTRIWIEGPPIPGAYSAFATVEQSYWQFRDSVAKEIALRGDMAIKAPDGIHPEGPGSFIYGRNVVACVSLDEEGNLLDMTKYQNIDWYTSDPWDSATQALANEYGSIYYRLIFDTAAYIPNALMDSMQPLIERAFAEGDYAGLLKIFKDGYKLVPVTGEEYRELVRQGRN